MFFLIRSAVCIGLVVSALPDKPGTDETDAPGAMLGGPAAMMARFCRLDPARCGAAIEGVLAGAGAVTGGQPRPAGEAQATPARRTTHPLVHMRPQVL